MADDTVISVAELRATAPTDTDLTETREEGWETAAERRVRESVEKMTILETNDPTLDSINSIAIREAEEMADFYGSDTRGWNKLGDTLEVLPNSEHNRTRVLKQCYFLYYRNPLARNIIRTYSYLTVGKGMTVSFVGKGSAAAQKRWDKIAKANKWEKRYRDLVTMTYLLGEWFIVRLPLVNNKHWDESIGRSDREALTTQISKTPPEKIVMCSVSPLEVEEVVVSDVNREVVQQYKMVDPANKVIGSAVKVASKWPKMFWSDDVTHFCVDNLETGRRGRPILEPVLRHLSYYNLFQTDRVMLNSVRARMPIIRKVANPQQKASAKTAMESQKLPHPGTVLICNKTEDWTTVNAPLDGASATRDGRALLLQISAGVSLPEYLVTGDASGGNYASTVVASAPLISMINDYRGRFAMQFEDMIEEATGVRPIITFPDIVQDDLLKVVQANSVLFRDGVLSKETYSTRVGLRYEDEKAHRDDERDEALANMENPVIPGDTRDQDKKLSTAPGAATAPATGTQPAYKPDFTGATPPRKPTNAGTVPPKQAARENLACVMEQLDALRNLVTQMLPVAGVEEAAPDAEADGECSAK